MPVLRKPKFCLHGCLADRRQRAVCAAAFGLGMILASISPSWFTLFVAAVIMVALGVMIVRC